MTRRLVFALALTLILARTAAAAPDDGAPAALAASVASQLLAECEAARAKTVAVSIAGAPGLEGVPALVTAARTLEDRLFDGTKLTPDATGAADLTVELVLSRAAGRVALGGAVRSRSGRSTWVLASQPETPAWAPWLQPLLPLRADGAGFAWARVATVAGEVLDADAGDLDGDGLAEFVAVTRDEILVFRLEDAIPVVAARTTLGPADPASTATRAPRAFVRVAPGAGGPGEVLLRFTDERRTRVLVWTAAGLEPRGEREPVILSSRPTARGADVVSMEQLAPGTNHFVDVLKVKRGGAWRTAPAQGPWLDLRDADVSATARVADTGASFGMLGADGSLRLLRSDLSELSRVPSCGAFALADWDADGKAEALCAGAAAAPGQDSLALTTTGGAKWSATVEGAVAAIASGPQSTGVAALAFVRDADSATSVWLLSRRAP